MTNRGTRIVGDVVTIFDGYPVRNVAHFSRLVAETPPGRTRLAVTPIIIAG